MEKLIDPARERTQDLLSTLLELRTQVGDSLTDEEFTHLAGRQMPEQIGGFSFLCYAQGCATFTGPEQNLESWHAPRRWISPQKERLAQEIAERFGLDLCEPPDRVCAIVPPPGAHHHLEFIQHCQTIAVVHPLFLKVRLFRAMNGRIFRHSTEELPPPVELFPELCRLYR